MIRMLLVSCLFLNPVSSNASPAPVDRCLDDYNHAQAQWKEKVDAYYQYHAELYARIISALKFYKQQWDQLKQSQELVNLPITFYDQSAFHPVQYPKVTTLGWLAQAVECRITYASRCGEYYSTSDFLRSRTTLDRSFQLVWAKRDLKKEDEQGYIVNADPMDAGNGNFLFQVTGLSAAISIYVADFLAMTLEDLDRISGQLENGEWRKKDWLPRDGWDEKKEFTEVILNATNDTCVSEKYWSEWINKTINEASHVYTAPSWSLWSWLTSRLTNGLDIAAIVTKYPKFFEYEVGDFQLFPIASVRQAGKKMRFESAWNRSIASTLSFVHIDDCAFRRRLEGYTSSWSTFPKECILKNQSHDDIWNNPKSFGVESITTSHQGYIIRHGQRVSVAFKYGVTWQSRNGRLFAAVRFPIADHKNHDAITNYTFYFVKDQKDFAELIKEGTLSQ